LLERNVPTEERYQLQLMQRNGQQLARLVNEILDLSKLEAGKMTLQETPLDFKPFLQEVFDSFAAQAQFQGIRYYCTFDFEDHSWILLDRAKAGQILGNLLANALKFTSSAGEVALMAKEEAGCFYITVKDTGKGIDAKHLPFIFDRYYQAQQPDEIAQGGTGIGLSLSKDLALLMKGDILVQSAKGEGSIFTWVLPALKAEPQKAAQAPETAAPLEEPMPLFKYAEQKAVVLLAEDHRDMQHYVIDILSPYFEVIAAGNGAEALSILEQSSSRIDLVLSDVMMPALDGFRLLEKIKESPEWRLKPVILITARSGEDDKLAALRMGVDDYLCKPFSPQELLARIQNLVARYQERKHWQKQQVAETAHYIQEVASELLPAEDSKNWLEELEQAVREGLNRGQLSVTFVADKMGVSERQLQRNMKHLIGLSPKQYFSEIQMQLAREMLEKGQARSVGAIAEKLGFKNQHYFSQRYEERFGAKPSDILKMSQ
jgi:DNA-binding response OmpR family regulator